MGHESKDVCRTLGELCKARGVKCLIQVGAEDGYEAQIVGDIAGCRAIALDGDPRCGPGVGGIEFHKTLIGATDGVATLYVHKTSGLSGQIPRGSQETAEELPQQRLDTFCKEHDIEPDALIIDTEGTAMDVLDGCGKLMDAMRVVYAECQINDPRPGIRQLPIVDEFMVAHGMTQHEGPPAYDCGGQGNYTWVRK